MIRRCGVTSSASPSFDFPAGHANSYETETGFYAPSENFRETIRRRTCFERRLLRIRSFWKGSSTTIMGLAAAVSWGEVSLAKSDSTTTLQNRHEPELATFMRDYDAATDRELVTASLDGDLSAFDEIVRRHQAMLSRCLYRFCPYRADLEDLVQEAFIKCFRKLSSWEPTAPFENWLRKIAYNTGYDYFRKNSRNPASIAVDNSEETEFVLGTLSEKTDQRHSFEMTEQAQKILALLPLDERQILTLQYLEELAIADIAEMMGWGLSKTKVKSFRARKKLRKILTEHGLGEETDTSLLG